MSEFNEEESRIIAPYFTNTTRPIFALRNLPDVVKGALFARYSRTGKSLRRVFLDEFYQDVKDIPVATDESTLRANRFYDRVLGEYGDDSIAQLGGAHLAIEGASQYLTKVLEWGRLMSYLEQSTRYVKQEWGFHLPREIQQDTRIADTMRSALCDLRAAYKLVLALMQPYLEEKYPGKGEAWERAIRSRALDTARGILPLGTTTNLGMYGSGQAYENMLIRMFSMDSWEVQDCANDILHELNQVIPAFMTRVRRQDRGAMLSLSLGDRREKVQQEAAVCGRVFDEVDSGVWLIGCDEERKVNDAILREYGCGVPIDPGNLIAAYTAERINRRDKPGRAFEACNYQFEIACDYATFRDLQRHRMCTITWQTFGARHGFEMPEDMPPDAKKLFEHAMWIGQRAHHAALPLGEVPASYILPMAYRVRWHLSMNAREAMHMLELRTQPNGHPNYRRICREMYHLIARNTPRIAEAMKFVDLTSDYPLGRLSEIKEV